MSKRETERQFIICGVFSCEEINSSDSVICQMEDYLQLCEQNTDRTFNARFIGADRFVVLLNTLDHHGEARLFDPEGTLLCQMGIRSDRDESYVQNRFTERHHLDIMKKRFKKQFGTHTEPFIVLLSHLIPCTEEGHECARLIREYAVQTNSKIIVSYDRNWH